jgi:hypothetical protein
MRERRTALATFQDVKVGGWEYEIRGVRVVIGRAFGEGDLERICDGLEGSLARLPAALMRPLCEIVVTPRDGTQGVRAGMAMWATGQVCLWCNGTMPDTSLERLEHECAHLLYPTCGAPHPKEGERAVDLDHRRGVRGERLVVPREHLEAYPEETHLAEDWAWSVELLCRDDRDPEGSQPFRRRYPQRAAIIDRALADGA